jgi:hypothetical protein
MALSASDLTFVFSGGASNADPAQSLGGIASGYPVGSGINNLFNDVAKNEALGGHVDYRCLYAFNNHATDSLYSTQVILTPETGGATKEIGVPVATDIQQVIIIGTIVGGNFTLLYDAAPVVVDCTVATAAAIATSMQILLSAIAVGVVVTGTFDGISRYDFLVNFEGASDHAQHPLMTVSANNINPPGLTTISVIKITNGAPINNVAFSIANDLVSPAGIIFGTTTINIGTINPGDGFPIWIKRTIPSGTIATYGDGLNLKISGDLTP